MKKILVSMLVTTSLFATAQAQTTSAASTAATEKKQMTKEEKQAAKAKKEADLAEAFAKAGVPADQQEKAKDMLNASNEKAKEIKASASSDEEKKVKLDAVYKERNEQLKTILGDEKYKIFKDTQKAQKEAAKAAGQ